MKKSKKKKGTPENEYDKRARVMIEILGSPNRHDSHSEYKIKLAKKLINKCKDAGNDGAAAKIEEWLQNGR